MLKHNFLIFFNLFFFLFFIHFFTYKLRLTSFLSIKAAEHSFQVRMPSSTLPLNYLCFGAYFLQELRLTIHEFGSSILVKVSAVAMATGLVNT